MPLRNLNQSHACGRICGTPKTGVKGSAIAATGDDGPGYLYRYLSLPADNDKEYSGYIPSLPAGLTFWAGEDSGFTASGADGVYIVPVDVAENGVPLFSTTFNVVFGSVDTTVTGTPGAAVAAGVSAGVSLFTLISALAGNATADGAPAGLTRTISAALGAATAAGLAANLSAGGPIQAYVGNAVAEGLTASISTFTALRATVAPTGKFALRDIPVVYIKSRT